MNKQIQYKVPISKIRKIEVVTVDRWLPVRITAGLLGIQLLGFGLFLMFGGSVQP